MNKTVNYLYLGENGTILSPVQLKEILCVKKYRLTADAGKLLTNDNKNFHKTAIISLDEIDFWKEVDDIGQN